MINTVEELLQVARAEHETAKQVDALGRFTTRLVQSDKLGFDWNETYLGDKLIAQEYVSQENPIGTSEDNPIIYHVGVPMIDNAFYKKDGKIQVYMSGEWIDWNVE